MYEREQPNEWRSRSLSGMSAQCSHEPLPDFSVHHKHTAEPPLGHKVERAKFSFLLPTKFAWKKKSNSLGLFCIGGVAFLVGNKNSSTFILALASFWAGQHFDFTFRWRSIVQRRLVTSISDFRAVTRSAWDAHQRTVRRGQSVAKSADTKRWQAQQMMNPLLSSSLSLNNQIPMK